MTCQNVSPWRRIEDAGADACHSLLATAPVAEYAGVVPKRKQSHALPGVFDSGEQIVNTAFAALSKIIKVHIITFSVSIFLRRPATRCSEAGEGRKIRT